MRIAKFEFSSPPSLSEALDLLQEQRVQTRVVAGGTDLVVQLKNKLAAPGRIVSLLRIPELSGMDKQGSGLRIGALVKHRMLESSPLLQSGWEVLALAAHTVGSPQIRSVGTLGGNICNASPAADTVPALLVLEAEGILIGREGKRRVPVESFFTGPGSTVLRREEILLEVVLPKVPENSMGAYVKLGRRKALDLALASAAVLLTLDPRKGVCQRARVALGAVSPTPVRARETEKFLEGKILDEKVMRQAGGIAQKECSPISDIRASAAYRQEMVKILVERAIKKSLGLPITSTGI